MSLDEGRRSLRGTGIEIQLPVAALEPTAPFREPLEAPGSVFRAGDPERTSGTSDSEAQAIVRSDGAFLPTVRRSPWLEWRGMQTVFLVALAGALGGCGGQKYSPQDMAQVRAVYAALLPTYVRFEVAYKAGATARILRLYARERRECKAVDVIDARDSIDPNINLFQASATLDGMCNTIDSAYAWWAKTHRRPYNVSLVPDTPANLFVGMIPLLQKVPLQLKYPDALT